MIRVRRRLTFANVTSFLALVLAVGGGGYAVAASGGGGVVRACVAGDGVLHLRRGHQCGRHQASIAWNQRGPRGIVGSNGTNGQAGPQGVQGVAGHNGEQGIQGIQGIQGPQGPGAMSFDGQLQIGQFGTGSRTIATVGGVQVAVSCPQPGVGSIYLTVSRVYVGDSFYGFGTMAQDGTLGVAAVSGPDNDMIVASGASTVELHVVAAGTASGAPVKFVRFDFSGIRGTACNYHGLIIPGDPTG
jgi:hypothetical protein